MGGLRDSVRNLLVGDTIDGKCINKECPESIIATICLSCEEHAIKHSLLPLIRVLRIRYGIRIKDAKTLAETVNLLVLGQERINKW